MINFKKRLNFIDKIYMNKLYDKEFNYNNISHISRIKSNKIFANEDKSIVQGYIFGVLNDFVKVNYASDDSFLFTVKKIIRRHKLILNAFEEQDMRLLEERVFSSDRHMKSLSTKLQLLKGEIVFIKFVDAQLFIKNKLLKTYDRGDLLISNKRVIIEKNNPIQNVYFSWKYIKNEKFKSYGWEFNFQSKKYAISIHDNETLKNTVLNFKGKVNIKFK